MGRHKKSGQRKVRHDDARQGKVRQDAATGRKDDGTKNNEATKQRYGKGDATINRSKPDRTEQDRNTTEEAKTYQTKNKTKDKTRITEKGKEAGVLCWSRISPRALPPPSLLLL